MGRPPAYIFIVRHGNRLDAADKLWHLSSPTPYDPPLTYGGWSQSRAIGQRIADILRENAPLTSVPSSAPSSPAVAAADGPPPKKRRYKIVIHSSPFLRCIQTSIAISSGIASDALPLESPRGGSGGSGGGQTLRISPPRLHKSVMRLDAFLGEWLSPGYFELITPPPSSAMMVASAKADLLRREDYSSVAHPPPHHPAAHAHSHSTSQLWTGGARSAIWSASSDDDTPRSVPREKGTKDTKDTKDNKSSSSNNNNGLPLPRLRTASNASNTSNTSMHPPSIAGYVAPAPQIPLSSRGPTPAGYVAHARDACVALDYQWDSMRPPYDWGDGGEFGEDWTAMHRRFRKGLQLLVDWYTTSDNPAEMVTKTVRPKPEAGGGARPARTTRVASAESADCAIEDDDSNDEEGAADADADADAESDEYVDETVVILVSHGAGCNALIGAITQQPVLMDVGLASLSVAARRSGKEEPPPPVSASAGAGAGAAHASRWTGSVHSGHPGGIVPLNRYYEMKLLASSDHLRSVPTTPTTPRIGASMASVWGSTRGRHSNSLSGAGVGAGTPGSSAGRFDGGQRSSSAGSFHGGAGDLLGRRPSGASSRPTFLGSRVTASGSMGSGVGNGMGSGGVIGSGGGAPVGAAGGTHSRTTSGITVGSGVTSFSPPSISTNRLGQATRALITSGLWSPMSTASDLGPSRLSLDGDESDDMEILLSFGPESPRPAEDKEAKQKGAKETNEAKEAREPATDALGLPQPPALTLEPAAGSDDGQGGPDTVARLARLNLASAQANSSVNAGQTSAPASAAAPATAAAAAGATTAANPTGLWIHPRVAMLSSNEQPARELGGSKRRWTVNESSL